MCRAARPGGDGGNDRDPRGLLGASLGGGLAARRIAPADVGQEVRGKGTNTRYVTNILPETAAADSLLVVEVITPGGHTSSYPPHRHDTDDLPRQSFLEETYYHRINPPRFRLPARLYGRPLAGRDAAGRGRRRDTGAEGLSPCATIHGYDLYYLNVMAGPTRTWKFHNAPEHEWLLKV